jgi:hypothetical protein
MKSSSSRANFRAFEHEAISQHSFGESPANSADAHIRTTRSATLESLEYEATVGLITAKREDAIDFLQDNQFGQN